MNREAIYTTLFTLLSGLQTQGIIKTVSRRVEVIDQVPAGSMPALFLSVASQDVSQKDGLKRMTLGAEIILYAANPDSKTSAAIALNNLIDAVETVMAPPPGSRWQSLGGLVQHAWIEGKIEIFDGTLGQRAAAIIPLTMLVP